MDPSQLLNQPSPDIAKLMTELSARLACMGDHIITLSDQLDEWLLIQRIRAAATLLATSRDLPGDLAAGLEAYRDQVLEDYQRYHSAVVQ